MRIDPEALRLAVVRNGVAHSVLARRAEISASHLANAMAGRRGLSSKSLGRLAEALGETPQTLQEKDDYAIATASRQSHASMSQ
jgi:plasmid maintenance system antidote protein VapI